MKNVPVFVLSLILTACSGDSAKEEKTPDLNWLTGHWERVNNQEGRQTFESWEKSGNNTYSGIGYTLSNEDTVFREELKIYRPDSIWIFEVTGVNEKPTPFELTQIDSLSFTAENPENEFPKIIKYSKTSNGLHAEVKSEEMNIVFDFVPLKR